MKYGFVVPNNYGVEDPAQVAALGVKAETLGFESVWVNHHVLHVGYVQDRLGSAPYHDALVLLTWLAAKTNRVRLGTSVLVMPYLHPMVLAKELATLDHLSGGRLVVGLGVGSLPEENAALGVPYASRGAYSNEFLQVLVALWTEDLASFQGEFFNFENIVTSPKPLQQPYPKLAIGGNADPALRRMAQYGDAWHPLMLPPASVAKRLPKIQAEAARVGREGVPDEIQVRLSMPKITPELVAQYAALGVTELVLSVESGDICVIEEELANFAAEFFS